MRRISSACSARPCGSDSICERVASNWLMSFSNSSGWPAMALASSVGGFGRRFAHEYPDASERHQHFVEIPGSILLFLGEHAQDEGGTLLGDIGIERSRR